ncbi:hypothetical protein JB92DRAFT_2837996 [Gautieria morchelliformis]|nr:hypothetical protein JB92DRAFT_2837996 [Gautieria morchelliformis]
MTDKMPPTSQRASSPCSPTRPKFAFDAAAIMTKLTDLGYYLGQGDIATKVTFVPGGRLGDRLVAHSDINVTQPEEVRLSLVGEISRDGAWLSPEGAYRPASKFNPSEKITSAKARFEVVAPGDPKLAPFALDSQKYMTNIRAIHEAALKDKAHRSDRRDPVQNAPSRLIVRYPLVTERSENDEITDSSDEGEDLSELDKAKMKQISFDGWPVSLAWREELDAVKSTHDVNPLPAYDLDHKMIAPKDYERCLVGAAVELHVTLIHYLIGKQGSTLVADLREMIVLWPPRAMPQSPSKRSLMAGPSSKSPKKHRPSAAPK